MTTDRKQGFAERAIRAVERIGNKLPHPFTLFVILAGVTLVLSWLLSYADISVTYLAASKGAGTAPVEKTVSVVNLLSVDELRATLSSFVDIYIGFAPLGIIMVMMLGIGLVEQSGMISALMRKTLLGAPPYLVTATLALVGINANLASDAGVVFAPAMGAALFKALGRNPWVGIVTGFAAASGGFTANFFVAGTDALLAGITESAAAGMQVDAPTHPLINWYFMIAATVVVTVVTTFVTERITVRVLGDEQVERSAEELRKHQLTDAERRGLRFAARAAILFVVMILLATIPEWGLLRNEAGELLPRSPFTKGIVGILFGLFVMVGVAYGVGAGTIRSEKDIPKLMEKGMQGVLGFLVVALPAALFIHFVNQSNLTTILAVEGGTWLKQLELGGMALIIVFILLSSLLNLFMVSGSAKWLILAPIFVPMFAAAGLSPAMTQVAYRIGDSSTNIISPLSYYIPVMVGFMEQYKSDVDRPVGIGTVIALEMPYAVAYMISLTVLLALWHLLDLALGPGAPIGM